MHRCAEMQKVPWYRGLSLYYAPKVFSYVAIVVTLLRNGYRHAANTDLRRTHPYS